MAVDPADRLAVGRPESGPRSSPRIRGGEGAPSPGDEGRRRGFGAGLPGLPLLLLLLLLLLLVVAYVDVRLRLEALERRCVAVAERGGGGGWVQQPLWEEEAAAVGMRERREAPGRRRERPRDRRKKGPPGPPGRDGKDGIPGPPGPAGSPGSCDDMVKVAHVPGIDAIVSVEKGGVLSDWDRERLLLSPGAFRLLRSGELEVLMPGLYFIYSQVFYRNFSDVTGHVLVLNGREEFLQCSLSAGVGLGGSGGGSGGGGGGFGTCHAACVRALRAGDRLALTALYPRTHITSHPRATFMGAVRLGAG